MVRKLPVFLSTFVVVGALLNPAEVAAGDSVSCVYNSTTRTAEISINSSNVLSFGIYVQNGTIRVGGDPCSPIADVNEVDLVTLNETLDHDIGVTIDFSEPFAPGNHDEDGSSDEIEFDINLGSDPGDSLTIESEFDDPLYARAGRVTFFGTTRNVVNANANEIDGIDWDVVMRGVESLRFTGSNMPDEISAQGGKGTGKPLKMGESVEASDEGDSVIGGMGPDDLAGGAPGYCFDCDGSDQIKGMGGNDILTGALDGDHLRGGKGKDRILGVGGHDNLYGQAGDDIVKGNKGQDFIKGGPGDDKLNGGPNTDACSGGPGKDTFKSCD